MSAPVSNRKRLLKRVIVAALITFTALVWREILPALIKLLGERDYTLRLRAIDLLRQLGPEAADAIPALSGRSDDDARVVRVWTGEALKRIDPEAPTNTSSGTSP